MADDALANGKTSPLHGVENGGGQAAALTAPGLARTEAIT